MLKKLFYIFIINFFFSSVLFARPELREMRFTNRARCALDSQKPAHSAFLLINNMDIARSLYRLAKARNEDAATLTQNGIRVYRYSIIKLLQLIHQRIVNQELPLLPSDLKSKDTPVLYQKIMRQCHAKDFCPELDEYLEKLWSKNNHEDLLFLNRNNFEKESGNTSLSCAYLKKFSPLEAQLFGSRPTIEVLQKIGEATNHVDEYLADCEDYAQQENVKVASFELSLPFTNERHWDQQGFDYWNSLKIYFSWAFRNAPEMEKLGFPFAELFKAVAIEDSVIITPDGCKSITLPNCEPDYLNQNSIREFAKNDFKQNATNLDILSPLPEGPAGDLLKDPFSEVNRDILDFSQFSSSDSWVDNFRENFSGARTLMRKKLLKSITNLDIVSKKNTVPMITDALMKFYSPLYKAETSAEEKKFLKNDLYYLCSEYNLGGNEELSFIKKKLDLLAKTSILDQETGTIVDQSAQLYFNYFDSLSRRINSMCTSLLQKNLWDNSFELDKSGFSHWYINKVYQNSINSSLTQKQNEYLSNHSPMLAYSQFNISKNLQDVICLNASDCARLVLRSIIDLYAATQYADTFWNLNQQIKSPNLFNPLSERTACKVYDPWFKTKSVLFGFFTDIAQAGLSTISPGVLFAKMDLDPKKAISFNQLVKDGKIQYDKSYDKQKINLGLALDFGKLLGVPCGISISHTEKTNPYNFLQFQGISVRTCRDHESNNIEVTSPAEININNPKPISQCLVCSLNFETVASIGSKVLPAASSTFFLVRALFRLYKGFSDPLNIPHSWSVDPKLVKQTLANYHGEIPAKCFYPLTHSKECL